MKTSVLQNLTKTSDISTKFKIFVSYELSPSNTRPQETSNQKTTHTNTKKMSLRDLLAARQRDELRASQRDYLLERFENLEYIHGPELSADLALIAGIAQLGAGPSSFWDSQLKEQMFKPDSVLKEVYSIVKQRLPQEVLKSVNDDCFDADWLRTDYYPGLKDVSLLNEAF